MNIVITHDAKGDPYVIGIGDHISIRIDDAIVERAIRAAANHVIVKRGLGAGAPLVGGDFPGVASGSFFDLLRSGAEDCFTITANPLAAMAMRARPANQAPLCGVDIAGAAVATGNTMLAAIPRPAVLLASAARRNDPKAHAILSAVAYYGRADPRARDFLNKVHTAARVMGDQESARAYIGARVVDMPGAIV